MEAEEQDFIVLLLTLIAGKTLSKYSPPLASPVLQYVYGSVLPAPSPSPASCTDPAVLLLLKPGNAALRCAEGHQEATSPQHGSGMSYYGIPGWELDRAGAAAASQHSRQGARGAWRARAAPG